MIILDSDKYYNLGSVSMISDLNGTVSQYIEYIPYGEEMYSAHRNTYNSPYHYTAKELDEETGLYYYGARYYNSKLSIWLSVDPMVEQRNWLSPYNYVQNNPIMRNDPTGSLDDWVEEGNTWTYVENIKTASQAAEAGYDDFRANGSIITNARINSSDKYGDVYLGYGGSAHYATATDCDIANGGKDFANYFLKCNQFGAYLLSSGINYTNKYADFNFFYQSLTFSGYNYTGTGMLPLGLDIVGSLSVAKASTSARLGTLDYALFGSANGSCFTAEANLTIAPIMTGEGGKYGSAMSANAGAYALKGEYSYGATIFEISYEQTIGGSAGSAHAGVGYETYFDKKNGTLNLNYQFNLGFKLGIKFGSKLTIPSHI